MTAVHDQGQPDTYPWRAAPAHLKTRRQLRAAGLSPGGQDVAALMHGKRRGRRLTAFLYDIALARPKRTPSPAQLEAIAKATREHQARAAQRHGLTHADLTTEVDPGPGWAGISHPITEEITTMSEYRISTPDPESVTTGPDGTPTYHFAPGSTFGVVIDDTATAIAGDIAALQATTIARDVRDLTESGQIGLGLDGVEDAPSGAVDHLAAVTAAMATADRIRRDIDFHQTSTAGDRDYLAQQRDAAQRALRPDPRGLDPREQAAALTLAAAWYGEFDLANERLGEFVDIYAARGVDIDVENDMQVSAADPVPVAVGHGQRIAHLHALVAVNQAREKFERYLVDMADAEQRGQEAADAYAEKIEAALERDEEILAPGAGDNRAAEALQLTAALVWRKASPTAAARVEEITGALAREWGVLVDAENFTVGIDPDFDAHTAQVHAEARAVRARETAIVNAIACSSLTGEVKDAVAEVLEVVMPGGEVEDPQQYLDKEPYRYGDLLAELGGIVMPEADHAVLGFTIEYLRGATSDVDLLDTPVMVDPGEEARGRVPKLLGYYAGGQVAAAEIAEEISVMTTADQEAARQVGRAIAAKQPVDTDLWPGYVDRDHVREELYFYAMDAGEQRAEADYIAEQAEGFAQENPELFGVSDDVGERIGRMAVTRAALLEIAANGKGLALVERRQITATLADIDSGRIADETQLPELMWVDERTKSEVDLMRGHQPGSKLSNATKKEATELIEASGAVGARGRAADAIAFEVSSLGDTIYSVAGGAALGVQAERQAYVDKRQRLGQALAKAGVDQDTKYKVREVFDNSAREAGKLGRVAAERRTQWKTRIDQAVAHRDDQVAQRSAVNAGRAPRTSGRGCANRTDRAAQPSSPAPARHTMRRPGPGVER